MDYSDFLLYFALASLAVAVYFFSKAIKGSKSSSKNIPPGPYPLPIIGNLLKLGPKPHISLTELAKTYGPVMTLWFGQLPTVIISSAAAAREALQKNDLAFSSRNLIDSVCVMDHPASSVIWLPVSDKWRNLRKICNTLIFSISRLELSQGLRREKVAELLLFVGRCGEAGKAIDIGEAAFTTVVNVLYRTFFSADLGDPSSEFTKEFMKNILGVLDEAGKPNLSDFFPVLKKIDPQGIRRRTEFFTRNIFQILDTMVDQRLHGIRPPGSVQGNDVLDALLSITQENPEEIEQSQIRDLLGDLFVAGVDTTSTILEWAMAELLHNPEKLNKVRAELQEIVGRGNTLEESDIAKLPYLQAVVKETMRLHPPVPFLVPRKADNDADLCGFVVPKNAQIFVNVWAIGRDPSLWENPNSFEPERFVGSKIDVKGRDFELIPFGAGRRICPGMPLAMRMLHVMLGSLIHGFDWKLEGGITPGKLDMEEKVAFTLQKAQPLRVIPTHV